jgi:rod shape-determining protein MreC
MTGKVQLAYARIFRSLLAPGRGVTIISQTPRANITVSHQEYSRLLTIQRRQANHIKNLQAQLDEAHAKIDELARLRNVPEWNRMSFQPAGIISDPKQSQNFLLINRGRADELAVGQFVLGDFSVIGTVSDVSEKTAKVKLITDPTSKLAVRVADLNAGGRMEGREPGVAVIPQVWVKRDAKREPKAGDRVYALNTPGFPEVPMITAEVVESRRDPNSPLLWEITVQPVCDIASLKRVAVVISGK